MCNTDRAKKEAYYLACSKGVQIEETAVVGNIRPEALTPIKVMDCTVRVRII